MEKALFHPAIHLSRPPPPQPGNVLRGDVNGQAWLVSSSPAKGSPLG